MAHRRSLASFAVLGALAGSTAAAALAPGLADAQRTTTITIEPFVSKLASYGGVLAWSHWDSKANAFALSARFRGHTEILPIAPRKVPFDVDVGPDSHGRAVAVYSRCAREQPAWVLGVTTHSVAPGGCVLYRYDFATRRERRVASIAAGAGSFYLPTIWRDEIAYVRARAAATPALIVQPLSAPRGHRIVAVALPGGPAGAPGPVALDLRGGELAFAWDGIRRGQFDSGVFVDSVPGSPKIAATQNELDSETSDTRSPGFVGFPALATGGVFYGSFDGSAIVPSADAFQRVALDGGAPARALAPHALRAATFDGQIVYAMYGPYLGTFSNCGLTGCTLVATVGAPYR